MDAAKSLPPTFDALFKPDQALPGGRKSNSTEPGDDIVAGGAMSIEEIEKLMEELRIARDYLRSEGERVRRMNARYAHLTRTASASVKIISESLGKWRTTEMEAATEVEPGMRRSQAPSLGPVDKLQHELPSAPKLSVGTM